MKYVSSAVTLAAIPSGSLRTATLSILLNGRELKALIDTRSTENFVSSAIIKELS